MKRVDSLSLKTTAVVTLISVVAVVLSACSDDQTPYYETETFGSYSAPAVTQTSEVIEDIEDESKPVFDIGEDRIAAFYETDQYNGKPVDIVISYDITLANYDDTINRVGVYEITKMTEAESLELQEQTSELLYGPGDESSDFSIIVNRSVAQNEMELEAFLSPFESFSFNDNNALDGLPDWMDKIGNLAGYHLTYDLKSDDTSSLVHYICFRQAMDGMPIGSDLFIMKSSRAPVLYNGESGCISVGEIGLFDREDDSIIGLMLSSVKIFDSLYEADVIPLEDCIDKTLAELLSKIDQTPLESEMKITVYAAELIYVPFYYCGMPSQIHEGEAGLLVPVWAVYWCRGSLGTTEDNDCILIDATSGNLL